VSSKPSWLPRPLPRLSFRWQDPFSTSTLSTHVRPPTVALPAASPSSHVDMKEFISVLVLVMRGRQSEKLAMIFNIMDLDHDGRISKPEMTRFLRTVDSLNGVKRTATARQAAVDAMFASVKTSRLGFLSRDGASARFSRHGNSCARRPSQTAALHPILCHLHPSPYFYPQLLCFCSAEFLALASQTRYHLGEQLSAFLDSLQRKFSTELTSEAASGTVGRAPPAPLPTPPGSGAGAVPVMLRTPSETTDEDAEYSQYKVAQAAAAAKPTPPTSPSLVASLE